MSVGATSPVSPLPPSGQKPPKADMNEVLKKLMKQADKDGDGELNQGEFTAIAGVLSTLVPAKPGESTSPSDMFTQADVNHDGKISMDELKGFVADRMAQGIQATNQAMQAAQQGKGSAFSSVSGAGGVQLSPDMQLSMMQLNLTNSMAQRPPGTAAYAQAAYSGTGYSASAYFKADGTEMI